MYDKSKEAVEEALRLIELDALIRQQDIVLPETSPLERQLEEVKKTGRIVTKSGKLDGRREAGKKRAKKNAARRKKTLRQQRWRRKWKERVLEQAVDGNHYAYVSGKWKQRAGRKWRIEEGEWNEHIQPCIPQGAIIELRRYDTSAATTIDNIVVYNTADSSILFDGKEHQLRMLGAIL